MSTKISKKRFVELLRTIIKREIEEASTTATAGGAYDTPRAFSGKGTKMGVPLDRRDSVASGSGFQKVEEQESINEAVLTISYQPIFDADKKDKLEKIAKKSGLAIRSRGKQGFTVDGKRANVEKFIKATRGMIEVKESVSERKNPKREKLKKDFKTSLKFVKGVVRKIDTFMKSNDWGVVDGFVTDKRTGLASIVKDMEKSMNQIIKMPVDESVNEDTKDIVQAKKLTRKLQNVEGKYRKAMYDLSDRLQADPKNHKLQDDLVKSYTKNVTSFMRDMVKLTKRVK